MKTVLSISGAALLLLSGIAAPAWSQEQGGNQLTFGVSFRAVSDSNSRLDPTSLGSTNKASVGLSFGLLSETATSRLAFDASTRLLAANGTGNPATGLTDPNLSLSYARESANADFSFDAALTETDLTSALLVTVFDTGTGTRRTGSLNTAITWGKTAPLGFGLSAGLTDIAYRNASPGLTDSRTLRVGATLRADLSQVLRLDLGLSASQFERSGTAQRDTFGANAGLTVTRPRGEMSLRATISDTVDGNRQSLTFGQIIEMPDAVLSYNIGATRGVNHETNLTGDISYQRELPNGSVSIAVSRAVSSTPETDSEALSTNASLGYQTALSPLSNLSLALDWAERIDSASNLGTTNTSFSATYSHNIAQDWTLNLGYTRRVRNKDGIGRGNSDSLFLELRRDFIRRF